MVDVMMDFDLGLLDESMDLLQVLEPVEFNQPAQVEQEILSTEEVTAADQLLDELLFKQPALEDFSNVTKVVTEAGKEVYILALETKVPTTKAKRQRKSAATRTPYDKKE